MSTSRTTDGYEARIIVADRPRTVGLQCPRCHESEFRTVEVRKHVGYVRRRRECQGCGERVTTSERVVGNYG